MQFLFKIIKWFIALITLAIVALYIFDYEYVLKGVRVVYFTGHTTAFIEDTSYFDTHTISNSQSDTWDLHPKYNRIPATAKLDSIHQELETAAYLVIKNDSIFHEYYGNNFGKKSRTNSFSMAKSIVSALLFKAIDDGYIENLNIPVIKFLPELSGEYASELTVGDLSSMASGLNWEESYKSPFSITARANYTDNLKPVIMDLKVVDTPGKSFKYLSGATQMLGMVIEKATNKSLPKYLSESFWQPMGMSDDALWQLDSEAQSMAKAFCCIASNARDFSRFGSLWLNGGKYKDQQLLSEQLVQKAQQPRFSDAPQYGYGLWLANYKGKSVTYMRGILGQFVICIPEDKLIITRLGRKRSKPTAKGAGQDFYIYIDEAYKMLNAIQ